MSAVSNRLTLPQCTSSKRYRLSLFRGFKKYLHSLVNWVIWRILLGNGVPLAFTGESKGASDRFLGVCARKFGAFNEGEHRARNALHRCSPIIHVGQSDGKSALRKGNPTQPQSGLRKKPIIRMAINNARAILAKAVYSWVRLNFEGVCRDRIPLVTELFSGNSDAGGIGILYFTDQTATTTKRENWSR